MAATSAGGVVYLAGGFCRTHIYCINYNYKYYSRLDAYYPSKNVWKNLNSMRTNRSHFCLVALGGKLYAIGGIKDGKTVLSSMEVYDIAKNTWTDGAPMHFARYSLAACVLGGKIYTFGGKPDAKIGNIYSGSVEVYDPATNSWTALGDLPGQPRGALAAVSYGGRAFVIGGATHYGLTSEVVSYDPGNSGWTTYNGLPGGREGHGATSIDNVIYVVGGWAQCCSMLSGAICSIGSGNGNISLDTFQSCKSPVAGGAVTYMVTARNTGDLPVRSIELIETLPVDLAWTGIAYPPQLGMSSSLAPNGAALIVLASDRIFLRPGASLTVTITGTIKPICSARTIVNRATTIYFRRYGCPGSQDVVVSDETGISVKPLDFVVKIDAPTKPGIGDTVSFVSIASNTGGLPLSGVTVVDSIPTIVQGVVFSGPPGSVASVVSTGSTSVVTWHLGLIPVGGSARFEASGKLPEVCVPEKVAMCSMIRADNGCSPGGLLVSGKAAGFSYGRANLGIATKLTVDTPSPSPGMSVTYTLDVFNSGSATLTSLNISDTLPIQVTFNGQTSVPGLAFTNPSGSLFVWSGAFLFSPGQHAQVRINGIAPYCFNGQVKNTCLVVAEGICGSVSSAVTAGITLDVAAPKVEATQDWIDMRTGARHVPPIPGSSMRYLITVSNAGNAMAGNIRVYDELPADKIVLGAIGLPPGWSAEMVKDAGGKATAVRIFGPFLAPGESAAFTLDATLRNGSDAMFNMVNSVTAVYSTQCSGDVSSETNIMTIRPVAPGGIQVVGGARGYINPEKGEQATIIVIPESSGPIEAGIYDMRGMAVRRISFPGVAGRTNSIVWDGRNSAGVLVAPGVYPVIVKGQGLRAQQRIGVLR